MFYDPYEYDGALSAGKARAKPIVHYLGVPSKPITVGKRATVIPTDHPAVYLNGQIVSTSGVVSVGPDGSFETRNTRYVLDVA